MVCARCRSPADVEILLARQSSILQTSSLRMYRATERGDYLQDSMDSRVHSIQFLPAYCIPSYYTFSRIAYPDILQTELVHGLRSLLKIIEDKGCIHFRLLNIQICGSFSIFASKYSYILSTVTKRIAFQKTVLDIYRNCKQDITCPMIL